MIFLIEKENTNRTLFNPEKGKLHHRLIIFRIRFITTFIYTKISVGLPNTVQLVSTFKKQDDVVID